MTLFVQRVLDGLADGSLYGALALAVVIVYQATGRLNLAQGEMATVGTYLALVLSSPVTPALAGTTLAARYVPLLPWPTWVAIVAAMAVSAVLGAVLELVVIRRIARRSAAASVRVTVALLILLNAWTKTVWGARTRPFPSLFPSGPSANITIAGARLRLATIGLLAVLAAVVIVLWLVSRRTKAGLAFRAVAHSPASSALVGIRVQRVWLGSWALAAAIGTLVGTLVASRLVMNPDMMVRILVFGFVAAAIGGFASPGGALVGGLVVGVGQSLVGGYVNVVGDTLSFPVIVGAMIVLLMVRPSGLFSVTAEPTVTAGEAGGPAAVRRWQAGVGPVEEAARVPGDGGRRRRPGGRALLAVLGLVAAVAPVYLLPVVDARTFTLLVGTVVALVGLVLIVGPAGQLSLGHAAFMGMGAYTVGIVAGRYGQHPLVGVAVAGLVGAVAGLVVGFPALRIRGQYLAVVTLAVAVVFPSVVNLFHSFTGGDLGPPLIEIPQGPSWFPDGGRTNVWFHVLSVAVALAVVVPVRGIVTGRWGRALRATTDDPLASASLGVDVARTRTLAFALATGLASLGGGLVAVQTQAVTSAQLTPFRSLALFALVMLCGVDSLAGAVGAALLYVGVPWLITSTGWAIGATGVAAADPGGGAYLVWGLALLAGTVIAPDGLVPALRRLVPFLRSLEGRDTAAPASPEALAGR